MPALCARVCMDLLRCASVVEAVAGSALLALGGVAALESARGQALAAGSRGLAGYWFAIACAALGAATLLEFVLSSTAACCEGEPHRRLGTGRRSYSRRCHHCALTSKVLLTLAVILVEAALVALYVLDEGLLKRAGDGDASGIFSAILRAAESQPVIALALAATVFAAQALTFALTWSLRLAALLEDREDDYSRVRAYPLPVPDRRRRRGKAALSAGARQPTDENRSPLLAPTQDSVDADEGNPTWWDAENGTAAASEQHV